MPLSLKANMVARTPFLYADVPSTMSFSVWPMTFRHIRSTAFALMPVGSDLASGRWVARISTIPVAGPRLTTSVQMSSNSAPYLGCSNMTWHSSTPHHDRVQAQASCCWPARG